MDISSVGQNLQSPTQNTQTAKAQQPAEKQDSQNTGEDRVEINSRNPANKQELMATYSSIRANQASALRGGIMKAMFGAGNVQALEVPTAGSTGVTRENMTQAATQLAQQSQIMGTQASQDNQVDAGRMEVRITNLARNTGNVISGPQGFASQNNTVAVNGANNTVSMAGTPAQGVSQATFNATGGPNIDNARVNVTGDRNAIAFAGANQENATLNVNGNNNQVNVGNNVDNLNVNAAGNNILVTVGDNNPLSRNQSGWNVNVSASNVSISIQNGQATVSGANGNQNFAVEINNETRMVTVTELQKEQIQADRTVPLPQAEPPMNDQSGLPNPNEDIGG